MTLVSAFTWELLAQSVLLALILERALSVAFEDPRLPPGLTKLPQTLNLPFSVRFPRLPKVPLRDGVTLFCAIYVCKTLPIELVTSLKPQVLPDALDIVVSALFITGIAQLFQYIFSHVTPAATTAPLPVVVDHAALNPAVGSVPKTAAFKLGSLQMAPSGSNLALAS